MIKFYFVPTVGRPQLISQRSLSGLLKDAATNVSFRNLYPTDPSNTGSIRAVIDANRNVVEINEANNETTIRIP